MFGLKENFFLFVLSFITNNIFEIPFSTFRMKKEEKSFSIFEDGMSIFVHKTPSTWYWVLPSYPNLKHSKPLFGLFHAKFYHKIAFHNKKTYF